MERKRSRQRRKSAGAPAKPVDQSARLLLLETRLSEVLQVLNGNRLAIAEAFAMTDVHIKTLQGICADLYTGTTRGTLEHDALKELRESNEGNPDFDPYRYAEEYGMVIPRVPGAKIDTAYYFTRAQAAVKEEMDRHEKERQHEGT